MLGWGDCAQGGTMSFGIIEVITLLLGLAGFGLQANPRAPTAEQALQYAIADADFVAHIDAASMVPGNYKLLTQLADQPRIKASPELQKLVRKAVGEIEGARSVAKMATGLDLTTDIADATAFFQVVPQAEPSFVVAVHGRFTAANLEKIAKMASKSATKVGAGTIVETGPHQPAIALTKDGVMLVGSADLVRDRLADGWKAPSHVPGTNLGYLADVISAKPVLALVMTMSPTARAEALKHLGTQGFAADIVTRHKVAAFSMFHDGIGWTWVDSSKAGLDSMELVVNGVLDVLRATQVAPRGIAKIAMGALDSYRGVSAQFDDLIKHKADFLKIVEAYTGDGNFKVTVDKNPKTMRLNMRATGKSVSEVLPFGLALPGAIVGILMFKSKEEAPAPPVMVEPRPRANPPDAKLPGARPPSANPAGAKPPSMNPPGGAKPTGASLPPANPSGGKPAAASPPVKTP
jgi:hypothetical protein